MLLNEYNRLQVNPLLNPKPLSFKCKHLFLICYSMNTGPKLFCFLPDLPYMVTILQPHGLYSTATLAYILLV